MAPTATYCKLTNNEDGSETVQRTRFGRLWFIHATFALISIGCLLTSYVMMHQSNACRSTPGFDHFTRRDVQFVGGFESQSTYRGPPTPEVDTAWDRFTANPWIDGTAVIFGVTDLEIARAGKNTADDWYNSTVQFGERNGGGKMATIEMFHQLHCLNTVRKFTFYEYYKDKGGVFNSPEQDLRNHVDHCLEVIRQVIMCNGDTNLITWQWVKNKPNPYPDFNVWHSCRDPEEILQYAKARQIPIKDKSELQKANYNNIVERPSAP